MIAQMFVNKYPQKCDIFNLDERDDLFTDIVEHLFLGENLLGRGTLRGI